MLWEKATLILRSDPIKLYSALKPEGSQDRPREFLLVVTRRHWAGRRCCKTWVFGRQGSANTEYKDKDNNKDKQKNTKSLSKMKVSPVICVTALGSGGAIGQSLGRRKCSSSEGLKGKVLEGYIYPCSMPTTFDQVESFWFMTTCFLIIQIAHNFVFRSGVMGKCLIIQNGLFDIEQAVKSILDKDFFLQKEISVHWPAIAFSIQGRADDLRCWWPKIVLQSQFKNIFDKSPPCEWRSTKSLAWPN